MHSVITSVNNAITLAQRLREISKNIEDAEFKNVLAELSLEMSDVKMALAHVTEDNAQLKSELTKLKHSKGLTQSELVFKDFAYYAEGNDGPFCAGCYDSSMKKIRLTEHTGAFRAFGSHKCSVCDNDFG